MGQAPSAPTTPLNDQLYAAVAEGDIAGVKALLQRQTPGQRALLARFANKQGRHALHKAAAIGHLELVTLLLELGAPTDALNRRTRGGNALHEAAAAGHAHVVRLLLEAGVCPFVQNAVGLTPMDLAMEARHSSALQLLCHATPWCGHLQVRVSPHNSCCWMKAWCVVAPRLFSQPFGSPVKALSPELLCFGSQGDCCAQFRALLDGCGVVHEEGPDALGAVRLVVLQCKGMRHKYYTTSEGDAVVLHLRPAEQTTEGYAAFRRFCSIIRRTHSALFGREGRLPLSLPPPPLFGQLSGSTSGGESLSTAANAAAADAAANNTDTAATAAHGTVSAANAGLGANAAASAATASSNVDANAAAAGTDAGPPVCPVDSAGSLCAPGRPMHTAGSSCKLQQGQQEDEDERQGRGMCCVVCLDAPRSLGLRHGQSVHRAVCYECARRLVLSADPLCPLCRRPVEEILAVY